MKLKNLAKKEYILFTQNIYYLHIYSYYLYKIKEGIRSLLKITKPFNLID